MAMLAEPRRKQKWSVDPRNSSWSKDDSKFGQRMLERMGWSKGKGLGKSEQGATDHIKVKLKNNSLGLGANVSHEDNWIAHQDDFNELLAQLNNCHGQSNNTDSPQEEQTGFSLEEKSKTAKKRVHYMKFTKGKDLSSRSEKDLNCIFGKRARSAKDQEQESSSSDSQGEKEENVPSSASAELDPESITKTVTSTLTMQEYFAKRMADLRRARGQAQGESSEKSGPSEDPSPVHIIDDDTDEPKKKKKKKKSKKATDEVEEVEDAHADPIVVKDEDLEQEYSAKKKKKRKTAENEAPTNENCDCTPVEELPPPKKKKQKKQKRETEHLNGHIVTEDQSVESEVVEKQKKKHREEVKAVGKGDTEALTEKKSKKEKKKKKKHSEEAD
ncbi:PIN2/TERF1-interacting telomerase inhibitor 1 isoform X2 [Sphaeramia orbicularis]|uniref:PIN2/TERF1-interacting telomerase inhibitor 1 isoform X2 n=1 Tax=Sphaeramia orbicularis TaxID=375764 RepID=UPI0011812E3E|nr:PIN2/TERF1-interacting telomerase inhibitor 1 isoform X2 [Sphaeramia orbicularis]